VRLPVNEDKGDFILQYDMLDLPADQRTVAEIQAYGLVENMIQALNRTFSLPFNIPVRFVKKKEVNAFYDPVPVPLNLT
jgi:hypothetical protein